MSIRIGRQTGLLGVGIPSGVPKVPFTQVDFDELTAKIQMLSTQRESLFERRRLPGAIPNSLRGVGGEKPEILLRRIEFQAFFKP